MSNEVEKRWDYWLNMQLAQQEQPPDAEIENILSKRLTPFKVKKTIRVSNPTGTENNYER